jgi:hypothetical protein
MSQNLTTRQGEGPCRSTTDATGQMPKVTSPYLFNLNLKTISKLTANSLNQSANPFTDPKLTLVKFTWLTILGGHRKLKALINKNFLPQGLGKISSVAQKQTSITAGQLSNHMQVMDIGWGQIERLNHAHRVDFHMKLETIKSLIAQQLAISCGALKKLAAFGPDKSAYRYGQAVQDQNVIGKLLGYVLEQFQLNRPQVSCLANKANPASKSWKVMSIESFEKIEDSLVFFQAQEFSDNFHGKYFVTVHGLMC